MKTVIRRQVISAWNMFTVIDNLQEQWRLNNNVIEMNAESLFIEAFRCRLPSALVLIEQMPDIFLFRLKRR
jgi:hypothetical protein